MPQTARKLTFNDILNQDPTKTKTIQDAFCKELDRRFREIKRLIKVAIVDMDCFGLKPVSLISVDEAKMLIQERAFAFPKAADKVEGFMGWLGEQENKFILSGGSKGIQITRRPGARLGAGRWSDVYIQSAYQKGIIRGRQELKAAGIEVPPLEQIPGGVSSVFNQPFHADRVATLYTRAYNELKGITNEMDQVISRTLAQGMADGRGPAEIARSLNQIIELPKVLVSIPGVGPRYMTSIQRARMMARTEVVRAHHQANIQEYKAAGLEGVKVKAEWSTAGYGVCKLCESLEGQIFEIDEIESMIPVHPNCRCVALPWRKEWGEPVKDKGEKIVEVPITPLDEIPKKVNGQVYQVEAKDLKIDVYSDDVVDKYVKKLKDGESLIPTFVNKDDLSWVVDGNHRAAAYQKLGRPVPIIAVDRIDALLKMGTGDMSAKTYYQLIEKSG